MFEFIKKAIFAGLTILSRGNPLRAALLSVAPLNAITLCVTPLCAIPLCAIPFSAAPLKCILMNNQECKAKPEIVNVNSDEPVFYSFSIKTSKCSGSCNNINHPYTKMSRTNETRHIKWHETCKCQSRLDRSVCNNKQR